MLARELALSRMTVHTLRKELQANAEWLQPESSLPDEHTETDEMFQNAGEKRRQAPLALRPTQTTSQQAQGSWHF